MCKLLPRMLAPYFAVLPLWCWAHNAWACILVYHALILLWSRWDLTRLALGWNRQHMWRVALPCLVVGPLVYILLPSMGKQPMSDWLAAYGLSGMRLVLLVPYFGVVHPMLEQAHWSSLRTNRKVGALAHVAFAGYHVLVLASLMQTTWLVASFGILVLASIAWRRLELVSDGGLAVPVVSHLLVDSGLVLAAVFRAG